MTRFFYLAMLCVLMMACSESDTPPANIIPQDKMKVILFDVLRMQEYAGIKYGRDTNAANANMPVMLQQVFSIYKVSKEDFYSSFRYYEAHPDKNKVLLDSLSAYTTQKRQEMYMHNK